MIDLYLCYRYPFTTFAAEIGYKIGTRADEVQTNRVTKTIEDGYEVSFIDNDFEDPDPERLYNLTVEYDPEVVVLPDIFERDELDTVLTLGRCIQDEGATPMVVPKTDSIIAEVPDDWIVGFSVPSGYGGTDVPVEAFSGRAVHLLGGSHAKQLHYADKLLESGASIRSVDTNSFGTAANFGNVVNTPRLVHDGGNAWDCDVDGYDNWDGRVFVSIVRYYELWRQWCENRGLL